MAKKIVNVVYRVDNAQLQATKERIQEIQKETKASTDAMNRYSTSAAAGGRQLSNTFAGLTQQLQQVRAQIELTDRADTKRLNELKKQYKEIQTEITKFNQTVQQSDSRMGQLTQTFQNFRNVAVAVFSSVLIRQTIQAELEMARLQGRVQGVERSFQRAFGSQAASLMLQLRTSTKGAVNDFELMQRTLQATNLGIKVENLGILFEFAAARAQQTGETVDYLVDSIVRGIGRKSVLVLDNLGLSATRLREQFGGVAIASKSVGEVSEGVAEIARVELEKMGGYAETAETKVKRLEVGWFNLKRALSERVTSESALGFFDMVLEGLTRMVDGAEKSSQKLVQTNVEFIMSTIKTKEELQAEIDSRQSLYDLDKGRMEELVKRQKDLLGGPGGLTQEEVAENDAIKEQYKALAESNKMRMATIQILKQYLGTYKGVVAPPKTEAGLIEKLNDEIENLNDAITKATTEDQIGKYNDQLATLKARLDALKNRTAEDSDPFVKIGEDSVSGWEKLLGPEEDLKELLDSAQKALEESAERSMEIVETKYDQEQREATEHAEIMVGIENDAAEQRKRIAKQEADYKRQLQQAALDMGLSSLNRILTATLINRDNDLSDLDAYYDEQIAKVGNNERARKAIEKKRDAEMEQARIRQASRDRDDALVKIAIDTAIGVTRALATPPVPNFPLAAIMAGAGLIEAATVKSVSNRTLKSRAFAKGEVDIDGPGTATSDSIPAWISKHESVITAEATMASKNLLQAINERKIDDRIMGLLTSGKPDNRPINVFDDSKLIKAIKANKVDLVKHGMTLYEAKSDGENFKRIVRSKIQGY